MTRAPTMRTASGDVREHGDRRLRVALRGTGTDLFGALQAVRDLGVRLGARLLVSTDVETVAADVAAVDGHVLELELLAPIAANTNTVTLRRAPMEATR